MNDATISTEFPFESRYIDVLGSRMHYIEEGSGAPILFLHGNPTSSYLWRNVIPHLSDQGRCIAVDLIGMGKSDKPDIGYRFHDHARYLDEFIAQLGLTNITLVIHDWGSGLGLHYARRNESNVVGIAMMEAIIKTMSWARFPPDHKRGFKMMRAPGIGWFMISVMNGFVEKMLPGTIVRQMRDEEMRRYREPFPTVGSRKPVRQWPREIPIDGTPADVHRAVTEYSQWLQTTELPKLLLHADPGGIVKADQVAWAAAHMPNLATVDIGPGIHFVQEDNPHGIGRSIASWRAGWATAAAAG